MTQRNTTHAFTLIELLVVVAIIVALIAILLPSMGRAISISEAAVCGANQRQLHVGWLGYAQANYGALSTEQKWVGQAGGSWGWTDPDNIENGQIFKYMSQSFDVFLCPTFAQVYTINPGAAGRDAACGYSINTIISERVLFGRTPISKLSQVKSASRLMVFSDENTWTVSGYSNWSLNDNAVLMGDWGNPASIIDAIGSFHVPPGGDVNDGYANVVFVDGHVSQHHISETKNVTWPIELQN